MESRLISLLFLASLGLSAASRVFESPNQSVETSGSEDMLAAPKAAVINNHAAEDGSGLIERTSAPSPISREEFADLEREVGSDTESLRVLFKGVQMDWAAFTNLEAHVKDLTGMQEKDVDQIRWESREILERPLIVVMNEAKREKTNPERTKKQTRLRKENIQRRVHGQVDWHKHCIVTMEAKHQEQQQKLSELSKGLDKRPRRILDEAAVDAAAELEDLNSNEDLQLWDVFSVMGSDEQLPDRHWVTGLFFESPSPNMSGWERLDMRFKLKEEIIKLHREVQIRLDVGLIWLDMKVNQYKVKELNFPDKF